MDVQSVEGTARVSKWPVVVTAMVEDEVCFIELMTRYSTKHTDIEIQL